MMVPRDGLEPSLPKKMDFESIVSTNSTTAAKLLTNLNKVLKNNSFKLIFKTSFSYNLKLTIKYFDKLFTLTYKLL